MYRYFPSKYFFCELFLFVLTTNLNDYHTVPVLISEFGVPESRGITHFAKDKGFNQGGLNEQQQGEAIVSMLEDILQSGCAGGYAVSAVMRISSFFPRSIR